MIDKIFIFNESGTVIQGVLNKKISSAIIPEGITNIGRGAFEGCSRLNTIVFPGSLLEIGRDAFLNCSSLRAITIPDGVTSIERKAFMNCTSLISVIIPTSIESIERYAFYGCSRLQDFHFPLLSIEYIGEHAFDGCPFEKVNLPKTTHYYPNSFGKGTKIDNFKVFISYSWDDDEHFAWVDKLANDLNKKVNVILDREELEAGDSKTAFINEIHDANKVICILTPEYKRKADNKIGVLGEQEYPIIKDEIENRKDISKKYIPILRKGTEKESIPDELSDLIFVDLRNDEVYDKSLEKLLDVFNH